MDGVQASTDYGGCIDKPSLRKLAGHLVCKDTTKRVACLQTQKSSILRSAHLKHFKTILMNCLSYLRQVEFQPGWRTKRSGNHGHPFGNTLQLATRVQRYVAIVETSWNKIPRFVQVWRSHPTVVACYNDGILSLAVSKSIRLCSALRQVFEDLLVASGAKRGLISCDWLHWNCLRSRQMVSHSWRRLPEPAKPQSHACNPDMECEKAYSAQTRRLSMTCEIYKYNVVFLTLQNVAHKLYGVV